MRTWGHLGNHFLFVLDFRLSVSDRAWPCFDCIDSHRAFIFFFDFIPKLKFPVVAKVHKITIPAIVSLAIMSNPWLGGDP